jgi:hypothetical protein
MVKLAVSIHDPNLCDDALPVRIQASFTWKQGKRQKKEGSLGIRGVDSP